MTENGAPDEIRNTCTYGVVGRFESCRRAAFEMLRDSPRELASRGTLALPGEPPAQPTRHHSRRTVQQPRTDQCPIVLHQAQGPAPCSAHSAWSPTQARRACAQRFGVFSVTSAYREWRNPRSWWLRNADGC